MQRPRKATRVAVTDESGTAASSGPTASSGCDCFERGADIRGVVLRTNHGRTIEDGQVPAFGSDSNYMSRKPGSESLGRGKQFSKLRQTRSGSGRKPRPRWPQAELDPTAVAMVHLDVRSSSAAMSGTGLVRPAPQATSRSSERRKRVANKTEATWCEP